MGPLWVFVILVFAAWAFLEISWPRIKGAIGEDRVSLTLSRLDQAQYIVLNDLLVPSNGSTKTTQIDHIVVSNFGVFVIETKAHKGWIFGSERQAYWTQVIYRYRARFYSPLRQNYAHIKSVETIIVPTHPRVQVRGFVVFPFASRIQVSGTDVVVSREGLISRILSYTHAEISDAERDAIVARLRLANIEDKAKRKQHIQDVRALV